VSVPVVPEPAEGWERDAACRSLDPSWFYVDDSDGDEPCGEPDRRFYGDLRWREACYGCPARADCLAHALLHRENFGVWGGLPPPARRHIALFLLEGTVTWVQITGKWGPSQTELSQGRVTLRA